jgi:predicted NBD/HSP70 family sugar kinase
VPEIPSARVVPRRASLDAVLDYAWGTGVFTAGDAMPAVGLTRSTTIDALDDLVGRGLLRELPNARAVGDYSKGRPARRFELRADGAVVVGLDAGRVHITATVADLRGESLSREHIVRDEQHLSADGRRGDVASAVDAALAAAGRRRQDVLALCVGVPAPVDAEGVSPPHREGFWRLTNPDLGEMFAAWAPLVRVENDASLAAVAEGSVGTAQGVANYVTLLAGERLGAGVVADGRLLRGAHGGIAEMVAFDHVRGVDGAWGLGYRAAQWAREGVASGAIGAQHPLAVAGIEHIDGRMVLELAAAGDPDASAIVERVGAMLARVAGVFGSLFDPELIVVSGAISAGIGGVLEAARHRLGADLDLPAPRLAASSLGADIVARGAVAGAVDLARAGALDLSLQRAAAG